MGGYTEDLSDELPGGAGAVDMSAYTTVLIRGGMMVPQEAGEKGIIRTGKSREAEIRARNCGKGYISGYLGGGVRGGRPGGGAGRLRGRPEIRSRQAVRGPSGHRGRSGGTGGPGHHGQDQG